MCCSNRVVFILKCSLAFKRVWDATKVPSLFSRKLIICWSVVAKFLAAFSMSAKPLTVWIDGLLYKLFSEFGIICRIWLAIRDLHTNVKAQVFYEGSVSRKIDVLQGTGQGRILAPLMYKVYVNELLNVLFRHCYAILINGVCVLSPSFADDISLLSLHSSFLETFMNICNYYSTKWGYDFNHSKMWVLLHLVRLSHSILSP